MNWLKPLWNVLAIVLLLHLLSVAGFVFWLRSSDRLTRQRLEAAVDVFRLTTQEEQRQAEEAAKAEQEAEQKALELARLESAADGPVTLADRLTADQQRDELSRHRVDRLREDIRSLRDQVERAKQELAKQRESLDRDRADFEAARQREIELRKSENFQQAVQMYEKLEPQQTKQMFQVMLGENRQREVVDYLAAMQTRKAVAVLGEFKVGAEIEQATRLVEQLRQRGVELGRGAVAEAGGSS